MASEDGKAAYTRLEADCRASRLGARLHIPLSRASNMEQ